MSSVSDGRFLWRATDAFLRVPLHSKIVVASAACSGLAFGLGLTGAGIVRRSALPLDPVAIAVGMGVAVGAGAGGTAVGMSVRRGVSVTIGVGVTAAVVAGEMICVPATVAAAVGTAVATVVVGSWTGEFDRVQAERVLSGRDPFDEAAFASGSENEGGAWAEPAVEARAPGAQPVAAASL